MEGQVSGVREEKEKGGGAYGGSARGVLGGTTGDIGDLVVVHELTVAAICFA